MKHFFTDLQINISQYEWINALLFIVIAFGLISLFRILIIRRIKKWTEKTAIIWDDFLISLAEKNVVPILYTWTFYIAAEYLSFNDKAERVIQVLLASFTTFFVVRMLSQIVRKFIYGFIQKQENNEGKIKQANGLIIILNIMIWMIGIVFLIDNLGYDVTTLIAGLGIGGIAIALAAQTILGDLFSYFVIFFDRPFEIGDFIIIDDKAGIVEYIGIKTTRIRTLSGEQLVCSNTDLTNARLHNYKRLSQRRIVFTIGVSYRTPLNQLKEIPSIVKSVIDHTEGISFARAHFSGYGEFSLNFECVYYVNNQDYNIYMDKQESILFDIYEVFAEKNIELSYRKLYTWNGSIDLVKN